MSKVYHAIERKTRELISQVSQPFVNSDYVRLVEILQKVDGSGSIWGAAIKKVFDDGGQRIDTLINDLAGQAVDDFLTMSDIIGTKGTILLLRYYNTKNPQ